MNEKRDALLNPRWADNPPVKINVDAKILGIVIAILGGLGVLGSLIALLGFIGLGSLFLGGIFFAVILGLIVQLAAELLAVFGGYQMYQLNANGKRLVIYGLGLNVVGNVVYLVGYGGYLLGSAIPGVVISLIVLGVIYYLVVISRFPGDTPLVPTSYGGYGQQQPPPPQQYQQPQPPQYQQPQPPQYQQPQPPQYQQPQPPQYQQQPPQYQQPPPQYQQPPPPQQPPQPPQQPPTR